ncbi:amino-acid transporter subunit; periplasmic-binding component of ABC superfamily [uncultured Sphingopyxis sp.]|uniref:Amino-acid transporter subunit periplasmic-binding component of ABC superfamily n=1 Tax=uncultured Sphingopyxis sp. TaxID=310581 RepID=A0A1Y5PX68_9SPHN|nr:amino acid ABC transporter substrate-binding protein [uncultured Sphingopyxis sp.]SBV31824.1 amino-acid transporter subunit; periplasmic-binding component of ABC superfamily [uncultured Sphingopyxis sp.]
MRSRFMVAAMLAAAGLASCSPADPQRATTGRTLGAVQERGYLRCGATESTVGFGAPDEKGYWRGLDVDTCRAIAAAVLGDREKARFVPLSGQQRLIALQTGEVDALPRTTTWTLLRDANGVNFTFPNYYDYTAFMVPRSAGVSRVEDLKGASVCIQSGSMPEVTFADISRKLKLELRAVSFESGQAARQAFFSGRCDAVITDASALESVRATEAPDPADYVIFPASDQISALTPAVRHGDDQWFDIVKFTIQAMITADHLGITQANVDAMRKSDDPAIRRFLGVEKGNGKALGLDEEWAYRIVKQVGNYGEVYDRNVGKDSKLKIDRGLNRLQRDGGLMVPIEFF